MTTQPLDVHVLVQDVAGGRAQWTHVHAPTLSGVVVTAMELQTPARRGAVWVARHWTGDRAADWGIAPAVRPVLALLTSELVGNAVVHGLDGGEIEVRMGVSDTDVMVEVSDSSPDPPQMRDQEPATPGGQGLRLVDMMSASWGHHPRRRCPGKTVWFRLDR